MPWFKVDDSFATHPKRMRCTPGALALWVTAGSWCAQQLMDGVVPRHVLPALGGRTKDAVDLVSAGLWEVVSEGWRFHDWADYQPSRMQVEAERSAARARQRRAREAAKSRSESRRDPQATNGVSHGPPDPTRPITEPDGSAAETINQRANRLAKTYTDLRKLSNFPAVAGVVRKAINAGYDDPSIIAALERLAADNRSVTADALRYELEGLPPSQFAGPSRPDPERPGFWNAADRSAS